jgi:pyroglutamyl-peptidase
MGMSRLLICGFGPFPEAPDNPAALAVEQLKRVGWAAPGSEVHYAVLPTVWRRAAETALAAAREVSADAVLLVGVAVGADAFRLETMARNQAGTRHPDAEGLFCPGPLIDPDGPAARRVIAPVQALLAAIEAEGLPVGLSSDAGDYLCNFTLYRLLAEVPMTAFLHVPPLSARIDLDAIAAAVRAAAQAFARELS